MKSKILLFVFFLLSMHLQELYSELVGEWNLNEGSGDTTTDSLRKVNATIQKGVEWYDEGGGNFSLKFDGTGPHVVLSDKNNYFFVNEISLEAWIKPMESPRQAKEWTIIGETPYTFCLSYTPGDFVYFYINGGSSNTKGKLKKGQYSHVVGSYDGKFMRLYINGIFISDREMDARIKGKALLNKNLAKKLITIGNEYFYDGTAYEIEKDEEANKFSFIGFIDEIKIYNHGLTAEEVKNNFELGPKK